MTTSHLLSRVGRSLGGRSANPQTFKAVDLKLLDPNPSLHDFKACPRCPHPPRPGGLPCQS